MSSFSQALLNQLEKASGQAPPWGDINPLVVIGLTEAILDLGLTEDQMYAVVRSFTRQLAAQVHPDTQQTNVSSERQQQIIDALNYLDDRENFTRALTDFRVLKAEDRREMKTLRETLAATRARLADYEGQISNLATEKTNLANQWILLGKQKREQAIAIRNAEQEKSTLAGRVRRMRGLVMKKLNEEHPWKKKFEELAEYFANQGRTEGRGIFAYSARWVVVVSVWKDYSAKDSSPVDRFGTPRKDFVKAAESLKLDVPTLIRLWKAGKSAFDRESDKIEEHQMASLGLSIIELKEGAQKVLYGSGIGSAGRVIGSIPPSEILFERRHLKSSLDKDDVWRFLDPFLTEGGLLVSISIDPAKREEWSLTCPRFLLNTRRLILAAG
jgi:hypothetical protein